MPANTNYTQIFYTVPYSTADIHRTSDGKKNTIQSIGNWSQYITDRNTNNTPVLAAIAKEDFIGIDIDNTQLFTKLFKLAPDCAYVALSLPDTANKGGHLLFTYTKEAADFLQPLVQALKEYKIDVQMGRKLIYLATHANKTKQLISTPLTKLTDLRPITPELIARLAQIAMPYILSKLNSHQKTSSTYNSFPEQSYGYMLSSTLTPEIVQVITPKTDYSNIKYMDDIPRGHATDWMLKVRQKLMADKTVSQEMFQKTIHYLNDLWTTPRGPSNQITLDISRDINSPDFVYDANWSTEGFLYPNRLGHTMEVFYDDESAQFVAHNRYTDDITLFDTQTKLVNSIVSTHRQRKKYTGEKILQQAQTIRLTNTPELPPLVSQQSTDTYPNFNTYKPSEGSAILQGSYSPKQTKHPATILKFFENLIPDEDNRHRFMQFLAYKHKTYEHSPLYFVLAGVGGAGKGVLVNKILRYFSGNDRVHQADLQGITNNFNSWMATTDWLELEEAGEGYSIRENEKLVGTLKKLTGNPLLTIEQKGKDVGTSQRHYMTPIISTNLNTKLITDTVANDRRLVLFKCPNKLTKITDDTRTFIAKMVEELPSFAYYLKNLDEISYNDYHDNRVWKTDDYHAYIEDTTSYTDKLFEAAESRDLDQFLHWLHEINVPYKVIDSLFSTSLHGKGARALLYNTTGTNELSVDSLQDIAETNSMIDSNVKAKFKRVKNRRSYGEGTKKYTIQVIEFDKPYKPLQQTVEPVSDGEEIEL